MVLALASFTYAAIAPAQYMNLTEFKIQTPTFDTDGDSLNVNLATDPTYQSEYFNTVLNGVRMSVPNYGARTSANTANPRTELSEEYRWRLPHGEHTLDVSCTIQKVITDVNFDIGQILRNDGSIDFASGSRCPLHLQIEFQVDDNTIDLKYRGAECEVVNIRDMTETYALGERIDYQVRILNGAMTFRTNKMTTDRVISDFNFLSTEYASRGEGGYFKAGVYVQESCSQQTDPANECLLGSGQDDVTVVDFHKVDIRHIDSQEDIDCPILLESGPITVTADGQTIENLIITAGDAYWDYSVSKDNKWEPVPGIYCEGFDNVEIKNVYVKQYPQGLDAIPGSTAEQVFNDLIAEIPSAYPDVQPDWDFNQASAGPESAMSPWSLGIHFKECDNITIDNVRVEFLSPPKARLASWRNYNIWGENSNNASITNVILNGASTGIEMQWCDNMFISNWAGYNVHGPYPRGQCLQTGNCFDGIIEKFICKNQWQYAWPEDSISIWRSGRMTVRDGSIIGNNALTGVGFMWEESNILTDSWGLIERVNIRGTGTCHSNYGGSNVTWNDCGCRDNVCEGRGGRDPGSSLMWYSGWENPDHIDNCCFARNAKIQASRFWNACTSPWVWRDVTENPEAWMEIDLTPEDFTFNDHPIDLKICFIVPDDNGVDTRYEADTGAGSGAEQIANLGLVGDGRIDYESQYDMNAENAWGICEDTCYDGWEATQEWELKCTWGKCAFCTECQPHWDYWIRDNIAHLTTDTSSS